MTYTAGVGVRATTTSLARHGRPMGGRPQWVTRNKLLVGTDNLRGVAYNGSDGWTRLSVRPERTDARVGVQRAGIDYPIRTGGLILVIISYRGPDSFRHAR
jgi:hypothetical protein